MASKQVLILSVLVVVAITVSSFAQAKEYVVGDDKGWTINFNYSAWTEGKDFLVGDKIVFKYPKGVHNVYKVTGPQFKNCEVPSGNESAVLSTGNDVITLLTEGRKWYICGVGYGAHCMTGQRLFITVRSQSWPPAPSPFALPPFALSPIAQSKEYIVGDGNGWTTNFNYSAWAEGKDFFVGDKIVFKYPQGVHNVYKVTGPQFQKCEVPSGNDSAVLATGNDVITLSTEGRKWYICGVGYGAHCLTGQRLFITVRSQSWATAPSPLSSGWKKPEASNPQTPGWMAQSPSPSLSGWRAHSPSGYTGYFANLGKKFRK